MARLSTYTLSLWAITLVGFATLIIGLSVSLSLQPSTVRNDLVVIPTIPTSSTTTTTASGNATTTTIAATTTTAVTTAPANTTTSPITLPAIYITCPPNVTVELGIVDLASTFTGGAANASGGCSNPIVQYNDTVVATTQTRLAEPMLAERALAQRAFPPFTNQGTIYNATTIGRNHTMSPTAKRLLSMRSPSYPAPNHVTQGSPQVRVGAYNPTNAASNTHLVSLDGLHVTVVSKTNPATVVGTFDLENCTSLSSIASHVAWDFRNDTWVFSVLASDGKLCIYTSSQQNVGVFGPYNAFSYNMSHLNDTSYLRMGIWTNAYVFSVIDENNLCVWQRGIDSFATVNASLPILFCGASFNEGPVEWTPMTSAEGFMPDKDIEAAGAPTIGAIFFRAIDDEREFNASTPVVDFLEVEHWYGINFTTATYNAWRYTISVADFVRTNTTTAVPTPGSQQLNARSGILMNRAAFVKSRNATVLTLTSNSSVIYWFELRWDKSTPLASPQWLLYQQGRVNQTGPSGPVWFMPSAAMDVNGSIVLAFAGSSSTSYPGLYMTSRLANDPLGTMRNVSLLEAGQVGSTFSGGSDWGSYWCVTTDVGVARTFFISGQVSLIASNGWSGRLYRVRLLGETIKRVWRAEDTCGQIVTCEQRIVTG